MNLRIHLFTLLMTLASVGLMNAQEICDNRIDDDGDGLIDCLDPDCSGTETCWECVTEFYQVHSNQYLVALDPGDGTYEQLATISGASAINGAQFNQVDGHVYAPCIIDGVQKLGMLQQDGQVVDAGLTLPGTNIFYAGSIDAAGIMYIGRNGSTMQSIDLNAEQLVLVDTEVPFTSTADLALDITNGLFYGINGQAKLKVFDPYAGTTTTYALAGSINGDSGAFGAAWSCNDGSFFAYNNASGKIYSINVNNLTATEVLNGTGNLSINDGFNCVLADPPFETACADGIDSDGDGLIDCDDPDCYNANECLTEDCFNGIDDDLDGWADCDDSECFGISSCIEICDNGIDDNGNGLIDDEDPQCTTPPGIQGGLESNRRLSDKIAVRNYYRTIRGREEIEAKADGMVPFVQSATRSSSDIRSFIPTEVLDADIAESTPDDLIEITNAVEVAAGDYYLGGQRIATVLGIRSENGVYEHAKYICDRLDGSRLEDISYTFAKGGNFLTYELVNRYGQVEYAVSFSAYADGGTYQVENHWNLQDYTGVNEFINFQVWARSYSDLIILLEEILDNVSENLPIDDFRHSPIPKVFVNYGEYHNGELSMIITNKNRSQSLAIAGQLRRTEDGDIQQFQDLIDLNQAKQQLIRLNTGHLYDLGLGVAGENTMGDEVFVADGAWGVDSNRDEISVRNVQYTAENKFYEGSVRQVERSIMIEADILDYMNIYRGLGPKSHPEDLSDYNSLVFEASGDAVMEVTLIKESISEWREQYRSQVLLTPQRSMHVIPFESLISLDESAFTPDDVQMIVFSILGNNSEFSRKQIEIGAVRFEDMTVSSTDLISTEQDLSVFPNPASDQINLTLSSGVTIESYEILSADGRRIRTSDFDTGIANPSIDVSQIPAGVYLLQVTTTGGELRQTKFVKG